MPSIASNGMISLLSIHSVDDTVAKLKEVLQAKGVTLFALIAHSGEAEKVGMKMPPTKLLIFGNPKGGTSLTLAAPTSAIDLPLKTLVFGGLGRKSVDFLQFAGLPEGSPRISGKSTAEHCGNGNACSKSRRIKFQPCP